MWLVVGSSSTWASSPSNAERTFPSHHHHLPFLGGGSAIRDSSLSAPSRHPPRTANIAVLCARQSTDRSVRQRAPPRLDFEGAAVPLLPATASTLSPI